MHAVYRACVYVSSLLASASSCVVKCKTTSVPAGINMIIVKHLTLLLLIGLSVCAAVLPVYVFYRLQDCVTFDRKKNLKQGKPKFVL